MESDPSDRQHSTVVRYDAAGSTVEPIAEQRGPRVSRMSAKLVHSARFGSKLEHRPTATGEDSEARHCRHRATTTHTGEVSASTVPTPTQRRIPHASIGESIIESDRQVGARHLPALPPLFETTTRIASEATGDDSTDRRVEARRSVHVSASKATQELTHDRVLTLPSGLCRKTRRFGDEDDPIALHEQLELAAPPMTQRIDIDAIARLDFIVETCRSAV